MEGLTTAYNTGHDHIKGFAGQLESAAANIKTVADGVM
jgi:hypothetical protein